MKTRKVSHIYEIPKRSIGTFQTYPRVSNNNGQPPKGEIQIMKTLVTIYAANIKSNQLYSKALQELNPKLQHQTITLNTWVPKHFFAKAINETKAKAFSYNTPVIYIADKGLYKLDQHLIHTHLCKGLPVKLYTPAQTLVFTTPQDFNQYIKAQAREYYAKQQNKIYYAELLQLAQQFNISKAKLDTALTKHRNKLISEGKTTNAYQSYLELLKQYIITRYDELNQIQSFEELQQQETIKQEEAYTELVELPTDTTPLETHVELHESSDVEIVYENYSLIDDTTLVQLQECSVKLLKQSAKAFNLKGYSKLNKAELINILIPHLYPTQEITLEPLYE